MDSDHDLGSGGMPADADIAMHLRQMETAPGEGGAPAAPEDPEANLIVNYIPNSMREEQLRDVRDLFLGVGKGVKKGCE